MGRFSRLGNDLYEGRVSIDFVGKRLLWYAISGVIIAVAVAGLWLKGLNMGIEFQGGVEYTVSVPSSEVTQANVDKIRGSVAGTGLKNASAPIVNTSGDTSIRVQTEPLTNDQANQVVRAIDRVMPGSPEVSTSEIGPSWGEQVANRALTGLIVFLVLVVLFIWAYFREWKMSLGALVALAHDLVITVGIYALSGFEVTPATVTGLLTILGFSLYDTVVVFDKVKENTRNLRQRRTTYDAAANLAVNQTLVRSINTSIVALLPVGAILWIGAATLGAGSLKDLALSLFVGMAAGLYSSIFIATPLVAHLKSTERDVVAAERREKARRRRDADPYASVPVFKEDMPIQDEPGVQEPARPAEAEWPVAPTTPRRPAATGSGRVVPGSKGPLGESGSSGRSQPSRQPRSKRGRR